jgi:hypothetical protein
VTYLQAFFFFFFFFFPFFDAKFATSVKRCASDDA